MHLRVNLYVIYMFFILLLFYFIIRDEFEFAEILCVNFRIKVNNWYQRKIEFKYSESLFYKD